MPREPATWFTRDRAAYYRIDAARLREMAEAASGTAARDVLVALAWYYGRAADQLEKQGLATAP